ATTSTRVGLFYSLNVCGAIAGSISGGFLLLPLFGSHGSLLVVAGLTLLSSLALARHLTTAAPRLARALLVGGPAAFALVALAAVDPLDLAVERFHRGETQLWRQEGVQTTVTIHERPSESGPTRIMYLDGRHQANDSPVMAGVHHRIGALPMMLHPQPRRALVIGMGGGATPGAVAQFPGVEVDVVELSAEVVDGARYFDHINFGLLTRPNVRLRVDDGRNFLLTRPRQYDVITADIILPRSAGASALYSREYFQLVRAALRHNGIALQWNGAETDVEYKLIMRTFLDVFPYTTLWVDGSLMVGSATPFTFSRRAFERRERDPGFGGYFTWDYDRLASLYIAGPDELRAFVGDGPVLIDDKPTLEYFLSLPKDAAPVNVRGLKGNPADVLRP
ncbi:MAG: fused MFS/spermidine synthase, partial [Vicinamibacteria bacterium]